MLLYIKCDIEKRRENMKGKVICNIEDLFIPIYESLKLLIGCEVVFIYNNNKHTLSLVGDDNGSTREICDFYLDDKKFNSLEELKKYGIIDGEYLLDIKEKIEVVSIDDEPAVGYIPYTEFIVGNDKLKDKNKKYKKKYDNRKPIFISKASLFINSVKDLFLALLVIIITILIFMTIVGVINLNKTGLGLMDFIYMWLILIIMFLCLMLFCSLRSIKSIIYIINQEKEFNINFNDYFKDKYLGKDLIYKTDDWFIGIGSTGFIAFNRNYISKISAIKKEGTLGNHKTFTVKVTDNKDKVFKLKFNYLEEPLVNDFKKWYLKKDR
ncbi:hypothetical protein ANASTE_01795 [Anaerofustis stercorihominis DSM 17244]|uniref:Uncharacterized protein n=2 Tax=Anaerofustis stercorihominis TaxID=214853 RepID=B1C927_9FIRM|nr:hypothetical protein ANASTE_01795 [Anaerofustis stercorihominis DSM 17244]